MKPLQWKLIPFIVFMVLGIVFWKGLKLDPRDIPSTTIGKPLPAFTLKTLDNHTVQSNALMGSVALLNVWASWCMSCADEQVTLLRLKNKGIPIYGLNYKDSIENASQWLQEWGNPYTMVFEDLDGAVAMNLGVYGAPETFLMDKHGIVQYRLVGPMTLALWKKEFLPRIQRLEAAA